ncbi:trypco2 family protein [Halochromatium glycolicum]|uniref:trypco2 family protein n=1 Tax=Halochromatium glycolicum TaxID=85075 RepID=UPI001A924653|nr:trypco2 family protein [Halochromatium glycolicum]
MRKPSVALSGGVEKAQQDLAESEATINPEGSAQRIALQKAHTPLSIPVIEFEAGVEVTSTGEASGGFQLSVPYFNLKTSGKRTGTTTTTNRIRFSVPVMLPPGQFVKRSKD